MARKFWVNTDRNAAVTKAIKDIDKYSVSADDGSIAGGLIERAGTGTSDSILAYLESTGHFVRLSDGEFVISQNSNWITKYLLCYYIMVLYQCGGDL